MQHFFLPKQGFVSWTSWKNNNRSAEGYKGFFCRNVLYFVIFGADNNFLPVQGFFFEHSAFGDVEAVLQTFGKVYDLLI